MAVKLVRYALNNGSIDNTSVLVLKFWLSSQSFNLFLAPIFKLLIYE